MTKLLLSSSALALVLAVPAVAAAQTGSGSGGSGACAPGSWFCQPPAAPAPSASPSSGLQPLPDPDAEPETPPPPPPRRRAVPPRPYAAPPPPPVAYEPPPPVAVAPPPPYDYSAARRGLTYPEPPHEWGLNLHLQGAMIGHGSNGNAGLGGAGLGLRFKPSRYFGLESDLDFLGGTGYAGDDRHETGLSFNGILFLNPRSRAQLYLLAGFGWTWAHSVCDPSTGAACPNNTAIDANYTYFGGQAGAGLEIRLSRTVAFNLDVRGFVRSRTDQLAQSQPEFTNSQGQSTNSSGGGLVTGGMTIYF
jgi:Outer membrane protein beta-barrel domain